MFNFKNNKNFDFKSHLNIDNENSILKCFKSKELPNIPAFLNKNETREELYNRYKKHNSSQLLINDIFAIIDENFKFTSYEEMLNVAFFIGTQLEVVFNNIETSKIKERGGNSDFGSFLKKALAESIGKSLGMDAEVFSLSDFMNKTTDSKKSNYTYELSTKLHIIDKATENELTVTNNMENVINEIIQKEGYNNIKDKRIFATGTDSIVSEILPKYDNNKCISVQFEVLNN